MGKPSLCYAVMKIKMMKGQALKKHMKIAASVLLKPFMSGNEIYLFFFEKAPKYLSILNCGQSIGTSFMIC